MSIKAKYRDGVLLPVEKTHDLTPGRIYTVFSDDELRDLHKTLGWLDVAEKSFDFWNNDDDAVYDSL